MGIPTDRFYNGGILFSIITLCFIAMISLYSFLLLVQCSLVIPGSFGGELSPPSFFLRAVSFSLSPCVRSGSRRLRRVLCL